jgi:hypothetical protein
VEDDFHLINNTGVWPSGCLIPLCYGRLRPDQIYSSPTVSSSFPSSRPAGTSPVNVIAGTVSSDGLGRLEQLNCALLMTHIYNVNTCGFVTSDTQPMNCFDMQLINRASEVSRPSNLTL